MVLSGHIYGVKSCWWLPSKELLSGIPVPIIFLCCSSCNSGRLDLWGTFCLWHDKVKRISSDAQYVTLQKIFFTSKFSYLLFCNTTHKTENGTAIRCRTTNGEPPGRIIMIGQSETLSSSQVIVIALFCAGAQHCCISYQPLQTLQLCWAKTIFLSQTGI
jgi:hypothetical protein